jgi:hypothetical protein
MSTVEPVCASELLSVPCVQQASSYDSVTVQQAANTASASVTSTSGSGNVTGISQRDPSGNGRYSSLAATVTQVQARNETNAIAQQGDSMSTVVRQTSSSGDTNHVTQIGTRSKVTITQTGAAGNHVDIEQGMRNTTGPVNTAEANVTETNTIGNTVHISEVTFRAFTNLATVGGSNNTSTITQNGGWNTIWAEQTNESNDKLNITQEGDEYVTARSYDGSGNNTTISQLGATVTNNGLVDLDTV